MKAAARVEVCELLLLPVELLGWAGAGGQAAGWLVWHRVPAEASCLVQGLVAAQRCGVPAHRASVCSRGTLQPPKNSKLFVSMHLANGSTKFQRGTSVNVNPAC